MSSTITKKTPRRPDVLDALKAGIIDGRLGVADYQTWYTKGRDMLEVYFEAYDIGRNETEQPLIGA